MQLAMEFDSLEFIHVPQGRYVVTAIGLSYDCWEDANAVASRYDGKVMDREAVTA